MRPGFHAEAAGFAAPGGSFAAQGAGGVEIWWLAPTRERRLPIGQLRRRKGPRVPLRLLRADRTFPDGSAELVYAPGEPGPGH